ncbi:tumor necrosis factor receptor superfamily member 6B-like [Glandiceps talaboti]
MLYFWHFSMIFSKHMSVVGLTVITIFFVTGLGQVHARCTKTDPLQKQFKNENRLCDLCPPGYYMLKACTRTLHGGTRCVRCPDDHYMPYNNSCPSCLLCTYPCRHNTFFVEVQPCTSTQNRVCKCSAGLYLLGDTCTPVTCPPGQKVALKEFPVCRPCPTMTFSSGNNNSTFCTPKTDCIALGLQVKWKGNKTHDAVCQDESKQVPTSPGIITSVAGT